MDFSLPSSLADFNPYKDLYGLNSLTKTFSQESRERLESKKELDFNKVHALVNYFDIIWRYYQTAREKYNDRLSKDIDSD